MELDDRLCLHYLNLNFSENFLSDFDPKVRVKLPYPISKPLINTETDIINKFHDDMECYSKQLSTARTEFQSVREKILNQTFTNTHVTITKRLLNLYNSDKCEAPFSCDYNPFYANGILGHLSLSDHSYLVRPDCRSDLYITDVVYPWKSHKVLVENEIRENITGISSNSDTKNLILLQYDNQVNLIKVKGNKFTSKTKWVKEFKQRVLDSKFDKNIAAVVLSNTKLKLYDIETNKKINSKMEDIDTVTRCQFICNDSLLVLSPKELKIVDFRSKNPKNFKPQLNDCDYLSSVQIIDNFMYLATRHYLIRADIRFLNNVEYCTHLMKYSPCYMDFACNYLCLASQRHGEKVLFSGAPINSLPVYIPKISDTLTECRQQKDILLRDGIVNRLQKSVGGVKILPINNDVYLYTATCVGDLFVQKITNNVEDDDSGPIDSLHHWINKLPEDPKPLHLTTVENLSNARFSLDRRLKTENLKKFTRDSTKMDNFFKRYKSRYSKKNLGDLAANFASIWDDDEEEEEEEDEEVADLVPEENPLDKVTKWIESSFFD